MYDMYKKEELAAAAWRTIDEMEKQPILKKADWAVNYFVAYSSGYKVREQPGKVYNYTKAIREELHMFRDMSDKDRSEDGIDSDSRWKVTTALCAMLLMGCVFGGTVVGIVKDYYITPIGMGIILLGGIIVMTLTVCGIHDTQLILDEVYYGNKWLQYHKAMGRIDWVLEAKNGEFGDKAAEISEVVKSDNSDAAEPTAIVEVAEPAKPAESAESDGSIEVIETEDSSDKDSAE